MAVPILKYTVMIKASIRSALRNGAISTREAEYLQTMAKSSDATTSTVALINDKGTPDFLYAALYFSTYLWQWGESTGRDINAAAGFKLSQFLLSQEAPTHDRRWAARLLCELYDAHKEATPDPIPFAA